MNRTVAETAEAALPSPWALDTAVPEGAFEGEGEDADELEADEDDIDDAEPEDEDDELEDEDEEGPSLREDGAAVDVPVVLEGNELFTVGSVGVGATELVVAAGAAVEIAAKPTLF